MVSAFADLANSIFAVGRTDGTPEASPRMESTSGPTCTHAVLSNATFNRRGRLAHCDKFLCKDAVDAVRLLYLSRRELYSKAQSCGGNVLIDEQ